jgi:hypothetical protein
MTLTMPYRSGTAPRALPLFGDIRGAFMAMTTGSARPMAITCRIGARPSSPALSPDGAAPRGRGSLDVRALP